MLSNIFVYYIRTIKFMKRVTCNWNHLEHPTNPTSPFAALLVTQPPDLQFEKQRSLKAEGLIDVAVIKCSPVKKKKKKNNQRL